ncbi:hypothetical protein [Chitinophaga sp. MM2321]|uniref:hypothetical protein n=1 Tax=Chitinophaga sp. MM2321 TaxID=3137178 RepID=UPI0032D594C7
MSLKSLLPVLLAITFIGFSACKKKNKQDDKPVPPVQEEALKFELPGILVGKANVALDSTYTFKVKITSKVPEKGVHITLNVQTDPGGIPLEQAAVPDTTAGEFNIILQHLKEVKTYKVTVSLSSLGNTANVSTPLDFLITNKSGG